MAKRRKNTPPRPSPRRARDLDVPAGGTAGVRGGTSGLYALEGLSEAQAAASAQSLQNLAAQQSATRRTGTSPLSRPAT
jgi:hypothetical protein